MRIVVYPHDLSMGGSQINAIEIAARVRDLGHEVVVFGQPGPLVDKVKDLDLEFVAAPLPRRRPSPAVMHALSDLVRDRGIDVIHGYEWPPALESYLVAQRHRNTKAVATVMSMAVAPFIPRTMPLIVGTEQIAQAERLVGRCDVDVLEPPVDLDSNDIAAVSDLADFRVRWGIADDKLTVVSVGRLAREMKLEGLLASIDSLGELSHSRDDLQLVIVGGGPAREEVEARADQVNDQLGRPVVVLTGELADPRPAYASADICLGMGGSALRCLAFGKPLVVQGENGFWKLLTESTVDDFLWTGWYGVGANQADGTRRLIEEISPLLAKAELRTQLGKFGRSLVEERFSLDAAAAHQLAAYRNVAGSSVVFGSTVIDSARSGTRFASYKIGRKASQVLRKAATDDFNSHPVVLTGPARPGQ